MGKGLLRLTVLALSTSLFTSTSAMGYGVSIGQAPSAANMQSLRAERMIAVAAIAPPLSAATFGSGVDVRHYLPQWTLNQAVASERTLYIVYTPPARFSHPLVGILHMASIHNIPLAHTYVSLGLAGDRPFMSGTRVNGGGDYYSIDGAVATLTHDPHLSVEKRVPHHTLSNGETCVSGSAGSGVAIYSMDEAGRRHPLLTTNELHVATRGLLDDPYTVRCNHFHGEDFATIGSGVNVVLRLNGHGAILFSSGYVVASDDDLLLIQANDNELLEAAAR